MQTLKASLPSDPLNEVEINSSDSFTVCVWSTFLWKLSFIIYDLFFHAQIHHQTHFCLPPLTDLKVESSWNVMAHGDAREGKWRGNWQIEWVASSLHSTSEHGVCSITTADAHTLAASSRLNWRLPANLNGLVRFAERRNTVSARVPSRFKCRLLLFSFPNNKITDFSSPPPPKPFPQFAAIPWRNRVTYNCFKTFIVGITLVSFVKNWKLSDHLSSNTGLRLIHPPLWWVHTEQLAQW